MVGAHPRTSCRRLFKKWEILNVPSQYIYSLMSFFIGNQEKFQTKSSVHNINTRNKHHFHRPVANLSCFQKGASYSGIRIFNSLPWSITNLKNEKTSFKVALKKFLNAHSFYSVDEFFTCADDTYYWLYDCLNVSFTVIFLCVCMFMTCSTSYCLVTLKDPWNAYMYVCIRCYSWWVLMCVYNFFLSSTNVNPVESGIVSVSNLNGCNIRHRLPGWLQLLWLYCIN